MLKPQYEGIQTWIIYRKALLWEAEHQSGWKCPEYIQTLSMFLICLWKECLTLLPTALAPAYTKSISSHLHNVDVDALTF